jgi:hypothetical protein
MPVLTTQSKLALLSKSCHALWYHLQRAGVMLTFAKVQSFVRNKLFKFEGDTEMKRSIFGVMFAALLTLSLSVVAQASTTSELTISSGGLTATINDNGACAGTGCADLSGDLNPHNGKLFVTGTLNGWDISDTTGTTNSPDTTPFGLDIGDLAASCLVVGGCNGSNVLSITYSDINFTSPGPFTSTYTNTQSGAGTTTESAFYGNSNLLNDETTQIGTTITYTSSSGMSPVTVSGGAGATSPYSLTLIDTFSGGKSTSFSVDGNIVSAPEGWSLSSALGMFGFGVVALVVARRRGLVKTAL